MRNGQPDLFERQFPSARNGEPIGDRSGDETLCILEKFGGSGEIEIREVGVNSTSEMTNLRRSTQVSVPLDETEKAPAFQRALNGCRARRYRLWAAKRSIEIPMKFLEHLFIQSVKALIGSCLYITFHRDSFAF